MEETWRVDLRHASGAQSPEACIVTPKPYFTRYAAARSCVGVAKRRKSHLIGAQSREPAAYLVSGIKRRSLRPAFFLVSTSLCFDRS